ncbi:hypothetical protein BJ970_003526 [Saccharopolyspora phatthalungensis]|uniref:STAS/SEC14 domain-containing protein n=1 Tax=Saccharopolyspora phatthalungensis TaxID=664693 RepID=A0A840Q0D1_9PSEU|nr:STAS/SEC14 domain-containing protein [Saccharopolyspora phatthalungensis]MBB5155992.1 hypothetical protein [Saccharopolyspora phatthalungensis]
MRDHHRKVKRVALSADSKLSSLVAHIAKRFVQADVNSFGYDEIDDAITWAAGTTGRGT